ncbi:cilia- and flagella-associated protein 91 [Calliopsis andreniformis]|uniref:cilia- and flagella-associated protein 91 n=1 Tax=Calliopsis andreniformis TaxID=337506 RepID=UPI003FCD8D61
MAGQHKSFETICSNNYKYFRRPIIPFLVPKAQDIDIPVQFNYDVLNDIVTNAQKQCYKFSPKPEPYKTVATQTDYRDSEAQTTPWEPPYRIKAGHNPETLAIAHLSWNHGLPPGVHELEVINRMRAKKAWEAALPPMDTQENVKLRTAIITALEIDEWAYRESEIQAIMDYRLELMEEITKSREYEREKKVQGRFDRLKNFLSERRDREVNNIKHNLKRELRKLRKKHQHKQQGKRDIIEEHADPASELYAPQMRHGENPQRRHEVIRKDLLKDTYIESVGKINTLPNWLPTYEELKAVKPPPKPSDLCIRETRWTEEKLKQLHSDLKAIRLNVKPIETSTLLKRKYKPPALPSTPYKTCTENINDAQIDQFSTLIQKLIRGRAIQCMMFEGRNRCRELIEELQSSHGLEEGNKKKRQKEKEHMIELQRLQNRKSMQEERLCEVLNYLEGMTISEMLDFLSKELIRLEDERRIHAFALLAERERAMREAAEAGRRQLEYNRRREFDEMFRQIVKVNQESVETYLEDIIKEGIEWVSEEAAKEYILDLCDKVDNISKSAQTSGTRLDEEELIASMIYNFVLPEVEKSNIRKNIRERQQNYLKNAHAVIYDQILKLPQIEPEHPIVEKMPKTCVTTQTEKEKLKSENMKALKDVETILESIISNVFSTSTHIN